MRALLVLMLVACSSKQGPATNGGSGSVTPTPTGTGCDAARPKIEKLYRAESDAKKETAERAAESIADNTQMVMNECVRAPEKVTGCIDSVNSSTELEKKCLAPLDEEGTEGEALRK